jgi:hypothetical protein
MPLMMGREIVSNGELSPQVPFQVLSIQRVYAGEI